MLAHLAQLTASLIETDGLNYVPLARSQDGRFNDVAFSDARALIKHLTKSQQRIGSTAGSFIGESSFVDGGTGTFNNSQYMDDDLNVSLRDQLRKQEKIKKFKYARDERSPERKLEEAGSDKDVQAPPGDTFYVRITTDSTQPISAHICSELKIKNESV